MTIFFPKPEILATLPKENMQIANKITFFASFMKNQTTKPALRLGTVFDGSSLAFNF
jgi:hypothetical protein